MQLPRLYIGVTKIFQVMKGKQKAMCSHMIVQRGRKVGEKLQYSVPGGKTLNDHYEAVGHHYQSKKEDLKISIALTSLVQCQPVD